MYNYAQWNFDVSSFLCIALSAKDARNLDSYRQVEPNKYMYAYVCAEDKSWSIYLPRRGVCVCVCASV